MLYLSESLQDSATTDGAVRPTSLCGDQTEEQSRTAVTSGAVDVEAAHCGSTDPAAGEPTVQQPTKPKKDKLARLKELGLDPPPVVKLCPDDGAFVQLEPPQLNPGKV